MCQDDLFVDFFAQIAVEFAVGIPQRFQIDFGGDCDPANISHAMFFDWVWVPFFQSMLKLLLRSCGPKLVHGSAAVPAFSLSAEGTELLGEVEEIISMHKQSVDEYKMKAFREACPKSMYWLGSYSIVNHVLHQFLPSVLAQDAQHQPRLSTQVADDCFIAAVIAVGRKYLYGQHVLAVTARERAWIGRHEEKKNDISYVSQLQLRVLRCNAGSRLTVASLLGAELSLKRALRKKRGPEYEAAVRHLKQMFSQLADAGIGILMPDRADKEYFEGQQVLLKYTWHALRHQTQTYLIEHRVPSFLFSVSSRVLSNVTSQATTGAATAQPDTSDFVATLPVQMTERNPNVGDLHSREQTHRQRAVVDPGL